jgi:BirA family biotin operon repressor/biotin-[acetyl-CoA-carboxylase] ligase
LIERLPETGSTSADLAARITGGEWLAEGHWLVADRQSAGRGRQGREWCDGAGNFMGSTLVRLAPGDPVPGTLALVAGLAVHEAVSPHVPPPERASLKWPNDVMVGAAKLAGILLERVGDSVVVGVGVNLAAAPIVPGRETVALSRFGPAPDRDMFAATLAASFAREVERWRHYGLGPVIARWLAAGHPVGTALRVGDEGLGGTFAGLADDGALRLTLADGTTRTIHAGEVNLA